MNESKMRKAKEEADRFLEAVYAMTARANVDSLAWYGCAESGQLRRSSMDLSRALIELRKVN